ncbi:MAG TPA: hypothetical protein VEC57_14980 [Candidatus Limnocylindrales bacterium]|nr:hypothetical protein [Candidatus Limnocylindrales bacterium]
MSDRPTPFTSWDDVPLICHIDDVARVLQRSVTTIYREVRAGTMVPPPLPRSGRTTPLEWRKVDLQNWYEGGYAKHDAPGARRRRRRLALVRQVPA